MKIRTLTTVFVFTASLSQTAYPLAISVDRCRAGDTLPREEALKVAKWAKACPNQSHYKDATDIAVLDLGISLLNSGAEGLFPVWYQPGMPSAWREPFDNPGIRERMNGGDCSISIPAEFSEKYSCQSGCYTPDQRLLFPEESNTVSEKANGRWVAIQSAFVDKLPNVIALAKTATSENLSYEPVEVSTYTSDKFEINQTILVFSMQSGGRLKVTTGHPLVDGKGYLLPARQLKEGDSLMRVDGTADSIVEVAQESYFGKVYNLDTRSDRLNNKIVLAEGYLNGTSFYQNSGVNKLNRSIFRSQLEGFL